MKINYDIFDFKIENKPFTTSSGKVFRKKISFKITRNRETIEKESAYLDFSEIEVKDSDCFDFRDCFVENFSVRNIKKINIISGENSVFFNKETELNFSELTISSDNNLDFSNSFFKAPKISFTATKFDCNNISFENSAFCTEVLDFSDSIMGTGSCNFSNCFFSESSKNFKNIKYGKGDKLFINCYFNNGNMSFDQSFFNEGKVSFKIANFGKGRKEFNEVEFGTGEVVFERVNFGNGNINFKNTQFGEGNANFKKVDFGNGNIVFRSSHFGKGDVSFMNSKFNEGKVNFAHVEFGEGKVDFHFAEFGTGDKLFERTNFGKGQINFSTVDFFKGKVNFKRAVFDDGLVNFEASELKEGNMIFEYNMFNRGVLNFKETIYANSELLFKDIDFGQNMLIFEDAQFEKLSIKHCQLNNNVNLKANFIGKLDLSHSIIRDVIDIEPSENDIIIKAINFQGLRLLGTIFIDWKHLNLKELIYNQDNSYLEKAEQFRMLKENFNSIGRYNDEDDAYVEFKRTELKSNYYKQVQKYPKFKAFALLRLWFEKLLFDKTGLYATSPARVILGMLTVYLFFSFTYYFIHFFTDDQLISGVGNPDKLGFFATAFYHSAITFFTIGYGDIFPTGILRAISAVEGFVGVFFMSYFTVAFVRKILR